MIGSALDPCSDIPLPDCLAPLHYRLLTVTYGTACAPYLAMCVIKQLILDESQLYPDAASVHIENFIYVDNILFGADNEPRGILLQNQLCAFTQRGNFKLWKWSVNSP